MYKRIIDEKIGETNYEINEEGVVRNIETKKQLSQQDHNGYSVVCLSNNGLDIKRRVNRLVAIAFLDKKDFKCMPNEKVEEIDKESLEVNHKDSNRRNNKISNLEWCTSKYNKWHGYINNVNYCRKKAVIGINRETKAKIEFDSLYMAGKYFSPKGCKEKIIKHHTTAIKSSIKNKWKAYGYYWEYKEDAR